MAGRFITLEGIEGVGKSTNLAFIRDYCEGKGLVTTVTREPGGTPAAEQIRELILGTPGDGLSDSAELLLMFAARADHLDTLIRPALERGDTVICDRFTDATFAYQGGGRGLDTGLIGSLEELVQRGLRPDLTILLDVSLEVSAERIAGRDFQDRFEAEQRGFFQNVRDAYLERAAAEPRRIKIVDASQPLAQVQAAIATQLDAVLS